MAEHVFISYARADGEDFATRLHDELEKSNFLMWLDRRDIKPGENWDLAIDEAIRHCWALMFVMTPGSVDSPNCHDEWSRALSFKRPVVPLLVRPSIPPLRLHRLQYIDFTQDFDRAFPRLVDHLRWLRSAEGELQTLRDRVTDLQRELKETDRPEAVQAEIDNLREQIAYKQRVMDNPDQMRSAYSQSIETALEAERQHIASARAHDQKLPRRRVLGSAPQGVSETFKDRAHEVATITNLLLAKDADVRAVSIYGMGGIGKTALACKVMQDLEEAQEMMHGLLYLSTRSVGISLERIFLDSARMLGGEAEQKLTEVWADQQMESDAKIQVLLDHYAGLRCVILLDNLEDLLDAQGKVIDHDLRLFIDAFLRQRHMARLLITSREPLNMADNARRYEKPCPLEQGLPLEFAIDLLKELDHDGQLGLADAEPGLLRTAAQKTHGYPRALEAIVGILAQDPFLSLAELLQDDDLFDERVIEKLVQEAQSRLDSDARYVMQALAIYGRPVREAAIRYLLEPYALGIDIGATLRRLARGRYLTVKRGSGELILHPLDKDYSYRHIPGDVNQPYNLYALHRRAADYYAQLRTPPDTWKSIRDLEPQLAEFEHRVKGGDYDAAARLIDDLDASHLTLWGHVRRVLSMREQLLGKIDNQLLEESNLGQLGIAYHKLGKLEQAIDYYQRALQIARNIGDRPGEATRLGHLGIAYSYLGRSEETVNYYHQALAITRELGDKRGEAKHLGNLGLTYRELGQIDKAIEAYQQALGITRELGNRQGEGRQLGNLALAYRDMGQIERAVEHYQSALAIARQVGDRQMEESVLGNLSEAYCDQGDPARGIETAEQARAIAAEIDDRRGEGYWLVNLGEAHAAQGNYRQALDQLRQASAIADEIHDPRLTGFACAGLAAVHLHTGSLAEALGAIREARRHSVAESDHFTAALLGLVLARQGERDAAYKSFVEAMALADALLAKSPQAFGARYTQALALAGQALLSGASSELLIQAQRAYGEARAHCGARGVVENARRLLDIFRPLEPDSVLDGCRRALT